MGITFKNGTNQKRKHVVVRQQDVGVLEVGRWFESGSGRQLAQQAAKEENRVITQRTNSFG
jgi:hypothetical protein